MLLLQLPGCCSLQLFCAFTFVTFHLSQMTQSMPTPIAPDTHFRTPRRGGVDAIYVNIQNLNLNMSVGSFVLPTFSYYLGKAFSFSPSLPEVPSVTPARAPVEAIRPENDKTTGEWTIIDLDTPSSWYPMETYQLVDIGGLRSGDSPWLTQLTESGLEQYGQKTRENEAKTTTLDDNVTEVIDKNLTATASSDNNNQTGERQEAPGGPTTSIQPPVVYALPLEFPLQETSRSVLGPGVSVAVTAAGIGLAMYSLARTYRYLFPIWEHPFPFYDHFSPNSTLSKTWVNVIDSVHGLNIDDMFTGVNYNSTNFKTD